MECRGGFFFKFDAFVNLPNSALIDGEAEIEYMIWIAEPFQILLMTA
jgi:hypothetical protein